MRLVKKSEAKGGGDKPCISELKAQLQIEKRQRELAEKKARELEAKLGHSAKKH